jgi:hypothetical protein
VALLAAAGAGIVSGLIERVFIAGALAWVTVVSRRLSGAADKPTGARLRRRASAASPPVRRRYR